MQEKRRMQTSDFELLLPNGVLDYFGITQVDQKEREILIVLEERNVIPEEYQGRICALNIQIQIKKTCRITFISSFKISLYQPREFQSIDNVVILKSMLKISLSFVFKTLFVRE